MNKTYEYFVNRRKLVDLHVHTNYSFDGDFSMEEILKLAKEKGLSMISITDHNSMEAFNDYLNKHPNVEYNGAYVVDEKTGIKIVPGVEVTTRLNFESTNSDNEKEEKELTLHLLVYSPKTTNNSLISKLVDIKNKHDAISDKGLIDKINEDGVYNINQEMIDDFLMKKNLEGIRYVRKFKLNDIATMLVRNGQVFSTEKFLKRYNSEDLPYLKVDISDVIKLAKESGAITILAHPTANISKEDWQPVINKLIDLGLDGVEGKYFCRDDAKAEEFNEAFKTAKEARKEKTLFSAGTDFHYLGRNLGCVKNQNLFAGDFNITKSIEQKHKQRLMADPMGISSRIMDIYRTNLLTDIKSMQRVIIKKASYGIRRRSDSPTNKYMNINNSFFASPNNKYSLFASKNDWLLYFYYNRSQTMLNNKNLLTRLDLNRKNISNNRKAK